jgi:hypothetical protein
MSRTGKNGQQLDNAAWAHQRCCLGHEPPRRRATQAPRGRLDVLSVGRAVRRDTRSGSSGVWACVARAARRGRSPVPSPHWGGTSRTPETSVAHPGEHPWRPPLLPLHKTLLSRFFRHPSLPRSFSVPTLSPAKCALHTVCCSQPVAVGHGRGGRWRPGPPQETMTTSFGR